MVLQQVLGIADHQKFRLSQEPLQREVFPERFTESFIPPEHVSGQTDGVFRLGGIQRLQAILEDSAVRAENDAQGAVAGRHNQNAVRSLSAKRRVTWVMMSPVRAVSSGLSMRSAYEMTPERQISWLVLPS